MADGDSVLPEPLGGWDEVEPHPGVQCHEAHPDRPHRQAHQVPADPWPMDTRAGSRAERVDFREGLATPAPPVDPAELFARAGIPADLHQLASPGGPAPAPPAAAPIDQVLRLLGPEPWTRFDQWAGRAWDLAEKAVQRAEAKSGDTLEPTFDPTIIDAARMCADLARAVCPLTAVAPAVPPLDLPTLNLPPL